MLISSTNHVIADRILSIICGIVAGEKTLKEKFADREKQKEAPPKTPVTSTSTEPGGLSGLSEIQTTPAPTTFRAQPEANEAHLQQVMLVL